MDSAICRPPRPRGRLQGVDALRGLAAIAVCLFHWERIAFEADAGAQLFRFGLLGVELFFMISGFAILIAIDGARGTADFVLSRAVRLYPAYLISVALTAFYVLGTGKYGIGDVAVNLTMLQSFLGVPNVTNPYWTLAFEISFYGLAAAVLARRWQGRLDAIVLAWLAVALSYRLAVPEAWAFDPSRPWARVASIVVMPQFAPFFALGMLIFRHHAGRITRAGWLAAALALAATSLGRGDFAAVGGQAYLAATLLFCALLAGGARVRGAPPALRALAWVGRVSYPLYLVHCTVANLCVWAARGAGLAPAPAVVASAALSVALAAALHRWVERPVARVWRGARAPARPFEAGALALQNP